MRTDYPATWFRLYAEFATDPKVQMLTETEQRRYIMLLCLRCSNGDVTLHDEEVAFQLRIKHEEWCETKAILMQKGLASNDNKPTAWEKRQRSSDSSAERVAKHRLLKKEASNRDVTLQKRQVETETEKEKEENTSPKSSVDDAFSMFWKAYPRKVGKGAAEKAWKRAKINGHQSEVLAALDRQKRSSDWAKDGGQFIPHPTTWINQRRWEDGEPIAAEVKRDWI